MAKHREKWEDKLQNYFKDIVYELDEDMSDIKRLDLSNKNLNYLPKELVNLTKLEALNLKDNNFTEIPNVIYDMNRLVNLNFSNNSITKISNELIQYYIGVCDGSRFPEFEFDFESCKLILDGNDNLLFTEEQLYNHFSYSNKNPPNYKFIFSPVILKRSILNIFKDDETFQFYMTPKKGENEFYYMTTQGTGNHEIDKLVDYLYTIDFSKDDYSFKEFCWNFFSKTKSEFFNLETLEVTDINTFEFISKHINEFNNLNRLTLNFSSNSASLKNISLFKSIKELEIHVDLIHNEIGKLEKLETLEISTFKQTHAFEMSDSDFFDMPTSFENLLNLNSLIFVGKIPRSLDIKHLNLSILVISSCPSSNFPKWIKDVKISTVQLHNCQLFEFTDESVDRVKEVSKIYQVQSASAKKNLAYTIFSSSSTSSLL